MVILHKPAEKLDIPGDKAQKREASPKKIGELKRKRINKDYKLTL